MYREKNEVRLCSGQKANICMYDRFWQASYSIPTLYQARTEDVPEERGGGGSKKLFEWRFLFYMPLEASLKK